MNETFAIHWFRRDLRVAGNPGLKASFERHKGRVVGLFCFDAKFLSRPDFSHDRFGFFLATLRELREELLGLGSDLLVIDADPQEGWERLVEYLRPYGQITVSYNRDYEPFARERDAKVSGLLQHKGVEVTSYQDHLVIEPDDLKKEGGGYYQIYSPFARKWLELMRSPEVQGRIEDQSRGLKYLEKRGRGESNRIFCLNWSDLDRGAFPFAQELDRFARDNAVKVQIPLPKAGSMEAWLRMNEFSSRIKDYAGHRDIPEIDGTSKLSMFLKNGSITSSQIIARLNLDQSSNWKDASGAGKYLKEIIWREFYYHILFHRPDVEHQSFLPAYRHLPWENRQEWFERWCEGTTGYPIVDAGMRQLKETGWMHNRVRMIVASFLNKDLLIDWRWGEKYFMEKLLDGDLAPNNGGWQWAASTGCDPQPYFRIFNPVLQSERFDPDGNYIKRYLPELRTVAAEDIHDPQRIPKSTGYPKPIVDHRIQKEKALRMYTAAKK